MRRRKRKYHKRRITCIPISIGPSTPRRAAQRKRGGSSKQAVVFLGKNNVRIRWMTGNEYAKLQGASKYKTDGFSESKIQYAFGDAVAVPVVNWLLRVAVLPSLISEDEGVEVNAEVC